MLQALTLAAVAAIVTPTEATALPQVVRTPAPRAADHPVARAGDDLTEPVRLTTRDKVELQASYYGPRLPKGQGVAPGALLVHDAGSSRDQLDELAENLRKRGFGVLTVDLRGHGGSATRELDWRELDQAGRTSTWALSLRDLDAALESLRSRKEIHSANLTLVGVGAACNLVLECAADRHDVRAVVLVEPAREAFGMDTASGMIDLAGLPCMILSSKAARGLADDLRAAARAANDGHEFVELAVLMAEPGGVLRDKRFGSSLTKWLGEKVQ